MTDPRPAPLVRRRRILWRLAHAWRQVVGVVVMLLLAGLYVLPFYWMFLKAGRDSIFLGYPPDFNPFSGTSWSNFVNNFNTVWGYGSGIFAQAFSNSLFVALSVTVLSVGFGSLAGYAFARLRFPGRDLLFYLVLATLMIPFPVIFISNYFFMYQLGWLNSYQGLIVPQVVSALNVFIMRQYFLTIPADVENAAKLDGLRPWNIFFRISAPLAKPAFAASIILTFIGTWNNFLWPLVVSTNPSFWTLPVALDFFKGVNGTQIYWDQMMMATLIMVVPTLVIYAFAERYFIQGISFFSVKR